MHDNLILLARRQSRVHGRPFFGFGLVLRLVAQKQLLAFNRGQDGNVVSYKLDCTAVAWSGTNFNRFAQYLQEVLWCGGHYDDTGGPRFWGVGGCSTVLLDWFVPQKRIGPVVLLYLFRASNVDEDPFMM